MKKIKITLVITHDEINYSGWFRYEEYCKTVTAKTIAELEENVKYELKKRFKVEIIIVERRFNISDIFEKFDFINISAFARYININESLLRQYKTGSKMPTAKQLTKIVMVFRGVADQMNRVALAFDGNPVLDSEWNKEF